MTAVDVDDRPGQERIRHRLPVEVLPWRQSLVWSQAGNAAPATRHVVDTILALAR